MAVGHSYLNFWSMDWHIVWKPAGVAPRKAFFCAWPFFVEFEPAFNFSPAAKGKFLMVFASIKNLE